jgi:hypothetical protein
MKHHTIKILLISAGWISIAPGRAWSDAAITTHHSVYPPGYRLFRQIISALSQLTAYPSPSRPGHSPVPIR